MQIKKPDGSLAEYPVREMILAIGHSARDTFEMLYKRQIPLVPKAFSVGARIEHPQKLIDKAVYHAFAGHPELGAADYKLSVHLPNGRSLYTFCMCPGGVVVPAASEPERVVTNGMSYYARDKKNANSALLVGVTPEDFGGSHPLQGMYWQRELEHKAYLAGGKYDASLSLNNHVCSMAAGLLLVKEAGGAVRGMAQKDMRVEDLKEIFKNGNLAASNFNLNPKVAEIFK